MDHTLKHIYDELSEKGKQELQKTLGVYWTHGSTAIEGNTLTMGETDLLIREGILATNRPLKECMEVQCHYNAIKYVFADLLAKDKITAEDVLELHRILMPKDFSDSNGIGCWKTKQNATNAIDEDGQYYLLVYLPPQQVPEKIEWALNRMNETKIKNEKSAVQVYCKTHIDFVSIHPFADGNGRIARLLANIPVMKAGFFPIVIPSTARQKYLHAIEYAQVKIPIEIQGYPDAKMILPVEDPDITMLEMLAINELGEIKNIVTQVRAKDRIEQRSIER